MDATGLLGGADAIGGLGASRSDAFSRLSSEEFFRIIFTELANQDPLQPSETKDLLAQLSSIRSIQSEMELSGRLDSFVKDNSRTLGALARQGELAGAAGLIGRIVTGFDAGGQPVGGIVVSVVRGVEGVSLNLSGGGRLPLDRVSEVIDTGALGGGEGA